jgi:hypothetical protein
MRKTTRRRQAALTLLAALAVATGMAACSGSIAPSLVTPTVATITVMPTIGEMLQDKTLGTSATNTIVEYVSFYTGNSATFHLQVVPQIKSQFVDTNRASLTFRNLFVGGESLVPAMLARCAGNANFFNAVNTIFTRQTSWFGSSAGPDAGVQQVMLGFGMSSSLEDQCLANSDLQTGLVAIHTSALGATYVLPDGTQRVGTSTVSAINAVPAVVVNGTLLDGTNNDGTSNPSFAPTLANIQALLK